MRSGKFHSKYLPYLALDVQETENCNLIQSELCVPDGELSGIDDGYERCYMMFKTWLDTNGKKASYEKLAEVLEKVNLSGIRSNYCLEGHHPPPGDLLRCKLFVSVIPGMYLNVFWFVENIYGLFIGRRHKRPPVVRFTSYSLCVVLCIFSAISASIRTIEAV